MNNLAKEQERPNGNEGQWHHD